MKKVMLCFLCVSLFGCTNFRKLSVAEVPSPTNTSTEIISKPAGAKIEIDGIYVGVAPLHVEIQAPLYLNGTVNRNLYVEAIPNEQGQYKQRKNLYEESVPRMILFNMSRVPRPKSSRAQTRINTMTTRY